MDCSDTEMLANFVVATPEPENSAFVPSVCCASTSQEAPFPEGQPKTAGAAGKFLVANSAWLDRWAGVPSDHGSPSAAASSALNQDEIHLVGFAHDLGNPGLRIHDPGRLAPKNPDLGRLLHHASQVRVDHEKRDCWNRVERFVRLGAC